MIRTAHPVKGVYSMIATYVAIVLGSILLSGGAGWYQLIQDSLRFVQGERIEASGAERDLLLAIPQGLAVIAIALPIAIVAAHSTRALFKKGWFGRSGQSGGSMTVKPTGKLFKQLFIVITLEEVFARWAFLGVLWPLVGGGMPAFYILFLLGNGIWALVHLYNWIEDDPHPMWVLPQFLIGILLTILYLKHGFVVALLAHFAYDCVIFCSATKQRFDRADLVHIVLGLCYAAAGYFFLTKDLSDVLLWLKSRETLALPGWSLNDYICLAPILLGSSAAVFGLLGYDQRGHDEEKKESPTFSTPETIGQLLVLMGIAAGILVLATGLIQGWSYLVFWCSRFVSDSVPLGAVAAAIFMSFISKDTSLSAMCRTFWTGVPGSLVSLCTLQALTVGQGFVYAFSCCLLAVPLVICEALARKR